MLILPAYQECQTTLWDCCQGRFSLKSSVGVTIPFVQRNPVVPGGWTLKNPDVLKTCKIDPEIIRTAMMVMVTIMKLLLPINSPPDQNCSARS